MLLEFDGTFIFALISFIIFVFLMNLILYKPVTKIISERQKFYDKNLSIVTSSKQKAQDTLKAKEDEIFGAKLEASNILKDMQIKTKADKEFALQNKKDEIQNKLSKNLDELHQNKQNVKDELKQEMETYVKLAVSKILDEEG